MTGRYMARVSNIERRAGFGGNRGYLFIRLGYCSVERFQKQGKVCFQKNGFKGHVRIIEINGRKWVRVVDSGSEEGRRLLMERGYEIINF